MNEEIKAKCEALKAFLNILDEDDLGTNFKVPFARPLDLVLPEDYLFFMNWSNGLYVFGLDILGIGNERSDLIENINWEQKKSNNLLPKHIIPFSPVGNGDFYCFDIKDGLKDGVCPVIYWQWDYSSPNDYEYLADSFVDWLAITMNEMIEEEE
ncbi:MAG: SMI1/KNR4 family protein [Saprospiraceae bacterium]|nr:SMI1/KNR4 family protein [Saprospiraceae bacterium]